jgi:hypothetical protein
LHEKTKDKQDHHEGDDRVEDAEIHKHSFGGKVTPTV